MADETSNRKETSRVHPGGSRISEPDWRGLWGDPRPPSPPVGRIISNDPTARIPRAARTYSSQAPPRRAFLKRRAQGALRATYRARVFGIIRDYSGLFGNIRDYSGLFGIIRDYSGSRPSARLCPLCVRACDLECPPCASRFIVLKPPPHVSGAVCVELRPERRPPHRIVRRPIVAWRAPDVPRLRVPSARFWTRSIRAALLGVECIATPLMVSCKGRDPRDRGPRVGGARGGGFGKARFAAEVCTASPRSGRPRGIIAHDKQMMT